MSGCSQPTATKRAPPPISRSGASSTSRPMSMSGNIGTCWCAVPPAPCSASGGRCSISKPCARTASSALFSRRLCRSASSGRLREGGQHLPLVGQQFLHARPLLHALEVGHAVLELGKIEVELSASPKAPKEVRIDSGEMVEEPFAIAKLVIHDPVI